MNMIISIDLSKLYPEADDYIASVEKIIKKEIEKCVKEEIRKVMKEDKYLKKAVDGVKNRIIDYGIDEVIG